MCDRDVNAKPYLKGLLAVWLWLIVVQLAQGPHPGSAIFVIGHLMLYTGCFWVTWYLYDTKIGLWFRRRAARPKLRRLRDHPKYKGIRWTPEALKEQADYFAGFPPEREVIIGSAIRAIDGTVFVVLKPGRHHHVVDLMHEYEQSELFITGNTCDQGFMTNTNRYLSRKEARDLHLRNNPDAKTSLPTEIYSEDLWVTPLAYKQRYT